MLCVVNVNTPASAAIRIAIISSSSMCVDPDARVQMAGGSEKKAKDVEVGDRLAVACAENDPEGVVVDARLVQDSAQRKLVTINGMKISMMHRVMHDEADRVSRRNRRRRRRCPLQFCGAGLQPHFHQRRNRLHDWWLLPRLARLQMANS